jgi:Putative restriction endonuclease
MSTRVSLASVEDRDLYPLHEEDDVTEIPFHERQVRYLRDAVSACHPEWFVTGNVGIYWERRNYSLYRAPDLFVVREPLRVPDPRVYLTFEDPPVIFVAEIGSRSTQRVDEGPKPEIYARHVRASEYLYADPPRRIVRFWRLGTDGYETVAPEPNGRFRSVALDLEFGLEADGFLRIYTRDGERLRTHEEAEQALAEEARRRLEAEQAAAEEARLRLEADQAMAEEARRRLEAEQRAAELERQLAELQARQRRKRRR